MDDDDETTTLSSVSSDSEVGQPRTTTICMMVETRRFAKEGSMVCLSW